MANVNASPNGSAAGLSADTDVLNTVVSRISDLTDRLSLTVPGQPTVLLAGVPQAARLAEALQQARVRQSDLLTDFVGFYRAGATSLSATAEAMDEAEDAATASFRRLHAGRPA